MLKSSINVVALMTIFYSAPAFAQTIEWTADKNNGWQQMVFTGVVNRQINVCYGHGDVKNLGVFLEGEYQTDLNPNSCITVEGKKASVRAYDPSNKYSPISDPTLNATGTYELVAPDKPVN